VRAAPGREGERVGIIQPRADQAAEGLTGVGYASIHTRHGDGYYGWPGKAPFDAIIVTAAPDHVPPPLLEQLKVGGVMVIPVGPVGAYQELWRITRTGEETYESESLGGVAFVPLTHADTPWWYGATGR